jgi:SAM-dependent methyltransferase
MIGRAEFDDFALKYEKTMERSCAVSGEIPDFYAKERMEWCFRRLRPHLPVQTALDFGCGTGGSIGYFFDILGCRSVIGVDPSSESLLVAKHSHPNRDVRLNKPEDFIPSGNIPLAFCNGVFHHIPPADRLNALGYVRAALSDNGILAFWENNPWNPVVLYAMSLNEFDRNVETLSPLRAVRLLKQAGFRVLFVDFCFFFPHFARKLRGFEPALRLVPVGAQYLVAARK